jgi:hypothetical protein
MVAKKNRVSIFGKTFHITPAGKILPLGRKNNPFTKCMSRTLKGEQLKGEDLTGAHIKANKDRFGAAVKACKKFGKKAAKEAA